MTPTAAINYDLAGILSPADPDLFIALDWGKQFRFIRGTPGKFGGLLPWADLNRILEEHRLEPPRLRLTRRGKPIPPETFLSYQNNSRNTARIPRLNATALTQQLREGATLVMDAVDELQRPVRRLAEALERVFRVRVQVNAYAGWRTSHGFDLHWDDHDVFILQVAGRKHWKVYGMTRTYPLGRDVERSTTPPTEVLWDGMLEDGDLLYIPRGWWHVATPLNEPTLHLTVGVSNPTGADLLSWFVDQLRSSEQVRRDLPHLASIDEQRAYAEDLRRAVLNAWNPSLIEQFLNDTDAKYAPRPHTSLPWSATEDLIPSAYRVRWNGARAVPLSVSAGEVTLNAHGRKWRFAAAAAPLLELLTSGRDVSAQELRACAVPGTDLFVKELITHGLIVAC